MAALSTFADYVRDFGKKHGVPQEEVERCLREHVRHSRLKRPTLDARVPTQVCEATDADMREYVGLQLPALVLHFGSSAPKRFIYRMSSKVLGGERHTLRLVTENFFSEETHHEESHALS